MLREIELLVSNSNFCLTTCILKYIYTTPVLDIKLHTTRYFSSESRFHIFFFILTGTANMGCSSSIHMQEPLELEVYGWDKADPNISHIATTCLYHPRCGLKTD